MDLLSLFVFFGGGGCSKCQMLSSPLLSFYFLIAGYGLVGLGL